MKQFMDKNFMLQNKTAEKLYFEAAADMPIFDYHCHLIPSQIAEDKRFTTVTDAWLGGDHYKWRLMRANGVEEKLVTGNGDPFDKFMAWADTMEHSVGNPVYHWTHLELQRYFGIDEVLNKKNAKAIYDEANDKFKNDPSLSVFGIMDKFKVYAVGTTDDPADDLQYHAIIRQEGKCPAKVIPSYRPDKALQIEKATFASYIPTLEKAAGMTIENADDVVAALIKRLDFFVSMGCKASDHALVTCPATFKSAKEVNAIFKHKMEGKTLTAEEVDAYKTYVLTALAKAYHKKDIAMQFHFSSIRDNNQVMFEKLGPDTGYDASDDVEIATDLSAFLKNLSITDEVPKTILYSLNPKDYYPLATLMGCYQGGVPGKMQLGSAWWFCDHRDGMEEQIKTLANVGLLSRFIGMLTDSRSFLSYSRHEYFRRILCNVLGTWVEDGEVPADMEMLSGMVKDISFGNAKRYFEGK
jgi:glucuronate isomerase